MITVRIVGYQGICDSWQRGLLRMGDPAVQHMLLRMSRPNRKNNGVLIGFSAAFLVAATFA